MPKEMQGSSMVYNRNYNGSHAGGRGMFLAVVSTTRGTIIGKDDHSASCFASTSLPTSNNLSDASRDQLKIEPSVLLSP